LVKGSAHDLEQVVVNLLLNAADAARGGLVVVGVTSWRYRAPQSGEARRSDAAHLAGSPAPAERRSAEPRGGAPLRPDLASGTFGVLLYVADSGPGVPPEDRERVFDPFFTTKAPGFGTGLGLAVVQRTVHQSGGVVWVEAAREGGAAFKVFLPAVEE
jgi:signal transduction histidine kinase